MRLSLFRKTASESVLTVTIITAIMTTTMLQHLVGGTGMNCPGSNATVHAKCTMEVTFLGAGCAIVKDEIKRRILGEGGWLDPHNRGTYMLQSETDYDGHVSTLSASRITGDRRYTDLFVFKSSPPTGVGDGDGMVRNDGPTCLVSACSESQLQGSLHILSSTRRHEVRGGVPGLST